MSAPSPDAIRSRAGGLREAAAALRARPYGEILLALDRWAAPWDDDAFSCWDLVYEHSAGNPLLREALLTLTRSARLPNLQSLLLEQLGHQDPFSGYYRRPGGGWRTARARPLVAAFLGGGAALSSWPVFLLGLLARTGVYARLSGSDLVWPRLFKESLAAVDGRLADCIAADHWPSGAGDCHRALAESANIVLAYGSDESLSEVRPWVPAPTPFLGFGSRLSVGIVAAGAALEQAAGAAARDVALYDQSGCLSPHVVLVEGNRGARFAAELDRALAKTLQDCPPEPRSSAQQTAIRSARELALFEDGALVFGPPDLRWTVHFRPGASLQLSPLGRTVQVGEFDTVAQLSRLLQPFESILQAAGVAATTRRYPALARHLGRIGFTRICPLGRMQTPTLSWLHDGRALLTSLVEFVDLETP